MVDSYRPLSLKEALDLRADTGAMPFAGGTDLMVRYRYESGAIPDYPRPVMFVNQLDDLRKIRRIDHGLSIGAAVTMTEVLDHDDVPEILKEALLTIAAPGLRNTATIAGNICNASPAGDSICALYALDAGVKLQSPGGERIEPIYQFITGPGKIDLHADEILTEIIIPEDHSTIHLFKKVGTRRANALSKLTLSAVARISDSRIDEIRIAIGAVAPTVVRSLELEKRMEGRSLKEVALEAEDILRDYDALVQPIDDQRSTAVYRKRVAMNLVRHFLLGVVLQQKGA
ncbi:MAG: xanthine dehydrogenase family protein subunit M [Spirochaetaceae bacterium]|nr:xanthine dehydrogenase family protein subunit M [Spirochaetaceae bacterium]MCF7947344.1 xanthine dehydrogenase family protein subunit M [Spirochaetia bacterium]MCF7950570.1 xanthine dehydrogenase family protein subunit M [Spirochaetaceae bacterium]